MILLVKRIYEGPTKTDGYRVLVDRLWPRGLAKDRASLDEWLGALVPSNTLRRWFGHYPARWEEIVARYHAELDGQQEAVAALADRAHRGTVTLLYAAVDEEHNSAVALRRYIEGRSTPHQER